jgi:hypothetical protein
MKTLMPYVDKMHSNTLLVSYGFVMNGYTPTIADTM